MFISYSNKNKDWATWLHEQLETFELSDSLRVKIRETQGIDVPKRLVPVFFDQESLTTSANVKQALTAHAARSRTIVLIASQDSARSEFVDQEIRAFLNSDQGELGNIHVLLVDGDPNSKDSLVPILRDNPDYAPVYAVARDLEIPNGLPTDSTVYHPFLKLLGGILNVDKSDLDSSEMERLRKARRKAEKIAATEKGLRNQAESERDRAEKERRKANRRKRIAQTLAFAAGIAMVAALYLRHQTLIAEQETRQTFSEADRVQAEESLRHGRFHEGVAYLSRSLESWPKNWQSGYRLGNLLMYRDWGRNMTKEFFHEGKVLTANFAADRPLLVTGTESGKLRLWDLETGTLKRMFRGPVDHEARWVSTDAAGHRILGWFLANDLKSAVVKVLNTKTGKILWSDDSKFYLFGKLSPNGRWVVVVWATDPKNLTGPKACGVVDLQDGKLSDQVMSLVEESPHPTIFNQAIHFSPDSRSLVLSNDAADIVVASADSPKEFSREGQSRIRAALRLEQIAEKNRRTFSRSTAKFDLTHGLAEIGRTASFKNTHISFDREFRQFVAYNVPDGPFPDPNKIIFGDIEFEGPINQSIGRIALPLGLMRKDVENTLQTYPGLLMHPSGAIFLRAEGNRIEEFNSGELSVDPSLRGPINLQRMAFDRSGSRLFLEGENDYKVSVVYNWLQRSISNEGFLNQGYDATFSPWGDYAILHEPFRLFDLRGRRVIPTDIWESSIGSASELVFINGERVRVFGPLGFQDFDLDPQNRLRRLDVPLDQWSKVWGLKFDPVRGVPPFIRGYSRNGRFLAVSFGGKLLIYDSVSLQPKGAIDLENTMPTSISIANDGSSVIVNRINAISSLWETGADGDFVPASFDSKIRETGGILSAEGNFILSFSKLSGGTVRNAHVWDRHTGKTLSECYTRLRIDSFCQGEDWFADVALRRVRFLKLGPETSSFGKSHDCGGVVSQVAFDTNGKRAFVGTTNGGVFVFDLEADRQIASKTGRFDKIIAIAVAETAQLIAVIDRDGKFQILDYALRELSDPFVHQNATAIRFSPDLRWVATFQQTRESSMRSSPRPLVRLTPLPKPHLSKDEARGLAKFARSCVGVSLDAGSVRADYPNLRYPELINQHQTASQWLGKSTHTDREFSKNVKALHAYEREVATEGAEIGRFNPAFFSEQAILIPQTATGMRYNAKQLNQTASEKTGVEKVAEHLLRQVPHRLAYWAQGPQLNLNLKQELPRIGSKARVISKQSSDNRFRAALKHLETGNETAAMDLALDNLVTNGSETRWRLMMVAIAARKNFPSADHLLGAIRSSDPDSLKVEVIQSLGFPKTYEDLLVEKVRNLPGGESRAVR